MQCYIYKSLKKEGLYIYVKTKDDFSEVPELLFKNFGQTEFVMELEITPTLKLAKENTEKVLLSLQEKGFFVQIPATVIAEDLVIKNSKLN